MIELGTTKYIIHAKLIANGYVEKHDIIGAIFGQTEGLLGSDLDLRDLQKSGRIGRIDVELENTNGKSYAKIVLPSSLDRIETAILAATLETIDRVGPCLATVKVVNVEDIRIKKRQYITNRAKELLKALVDNMIDTYEITEEIKEYIRTEEIMEYGEDKLPSGPNIDNSDAIIIVEGRADVINLLRCGIKNAIAVEGTSIPPIISELSKKKTTTIFTDGDRGGELILKEALQTCDIDYIARAPHGREVEELSKKEVIKCLRSKIPIEQYMQLNATKYTNGNSCNQNTPLPLEDASKTTSNIVDIDNTTNANAIDNNFINELNIDNDNNISNSYKCNDIAENAVKTHPISQVEEDISNMGLIKKNKEEDEETCKPCKLFENNDYNVQLNYIMSSIKELSGTNNIKIITDKYEEIKSFNDLKECIGNMDKNIKYIISDAPITQKMIDMVCNNNSSNNPIIIGKEIKITKKPLGLKIFTYNNLNLKSNII